METADLCMGCMNEKGDLKICPNCGWAEGTMPDSPLFLQPGAILEKKYLIGRVLGQGGFGITYLAWDLNLNLKLAIKEYFPQDLATRAAGYSQVSAYSGSQGSQYEYGLDKFLQEARTLAQFEGHANIVSVRDFFRANGTAYFVMSYVEGITLKDHLANLGGKMTIEQAQAVMMPVLDALREVHKVNVLHRDVSPDNVFINLKGQVVLIDFGAARQAIGEKGHSLSIILKPGYAPEEQYRSKGIQGPWTDIYAVAATLYHLITGQLPPESLERLMEDNLTSPRDLGAAINEAQEKAVLKGLGVRAADRYQTVEEFQAALMGQHPKGSMVAAVPKPVNESQHKEIKTPEKSKKLPFIIGVAAIVLIALGAATYALYSSDLFGEGITAQPDETEIIMTEEVEQPEEVEEELEPLVINTTGNTTGNIINGGIAAIQGDTLYFRSNEGGSLARSYLNREGSRVISSDAVWFINIVGEWVFYSNRDDNDRLYKIKTDGSERLALTEGSAWFVTVIEDVVYYIGEDEDYYIYQTNPNGIESVQIGEDSAWFISIDGDWIYYINRDDRDRIYKVKTDGTENTAISDHSACCINLYEGQIYYTNEEAGSSIYSIDPESKDTVELTDHPAWFVNVSDGWIYYANEDDDFSLNKVMLDGTGRVKLTNDSVRYISVVDDWVFYVDYADEDSTYKIFKDGTRQSLVERGF